MTVFWLAEAYSVPTVDTADTVRLELVPCVQALVGLFCVILFRLTLPLLVSFAVELLKLAVETPALITPLVPITVLFAYKRKKVEEDVTVELIVPLMVSTDEVAVLPEEE